MFVRPNGSQRRLPVGCGVSPFLLITASLLLVPQVYVPPQNMVAAWPALRPRFTCGLGSSGSSHVSCECPTVRALAHCTVVRRPRNRVVCHGAKSVVAFASDSTDQETQAAGFVISHSTVECPGRDCSRTNTFLFKKKKRKEKCSTDPRSENWAMFAGVAFSFQPRWAGNDSWILLPDNKAAISLSFQPILTRQRQYGLVQPNIRTDMIGVHWTWNEFPRKGPLFRSPRCDRAEGKGTCAASARLFRPTPSMTL